MDTAAAGNGTGGAGVQCASGAWDTVDLGCINTYKVDSQIFATMITSGVAGLLCLGAFCVLQSFVSVYRGRLLSPQVAIKPPVYTGDGIAKYFYWAWATVSMKEKELLATAGMDALMFERLIVFGLQLMAPLTILSCSALIPVHASSDYLARSSQQFQRSNLMGLTMSNMEPGSSVLWLHFALVWLYCLYAMWLLDCHYQWYVLLRQQYMTRGDSISTWLGRSPKQRFQGMRDKSALAAESPTRQLLLHPNWGFARCRPSAAEGSEDVAQQQAVTAEDYSCKLTACNAGSFNTDGQQQQQQRGPAAVQVATAGATSRPEAATAGLSPDGSCLTSRQSSSRALLSPEGVVRSSSQHMHEVSVELVTVLEAEGGRQTKHTGSPAACDLFHAPVSKATKEHATIAAAAAAPGAASGHAARRSRNGHADVSFSGCVPADEGDQPSAFVSAAGQVAGGARCSKSSIGGPSFLRRWNSSGWQRLSRRGSDNGVLDPERQAALQGQLQLEWQQQQLQRRQQAAAEAAAAAAAATKLGADVEWWAFRTGDPLLDRHVVQVDVAGDLEWDMPGPETTRLQRWWELASPDTGRQCTTSAPGVSISGPSVNAVAAAPSELHCGIRSTRSTVDDEAAGLSNIAAVPGTRLLFDRRSLLARKPSVRFRNTVHVRGADGSILPLHVSNYAVLVTDVPGGDGTTEEEDEDDEPTESQNRPTLLLRLLQAAVWHWPCLLRQADLSDLGWASSWNSQSFRAHGRSKSMLFSDSMRQLIQQHQQHEVEEQQQQQDELLPAQQQTASRHQQRASGEAPMQQQQQQQISDRQRLVEQTFRQLFPDELHAVIPVRNFQAVDELLRQWNVDLQAFIQGRALLQLRLERAARAAAAAISCRAERKKLGGSLSLDGTAAGAAAASDVESGRLPELAAVASGPASAAEQVQSSSSPHRRPAAAAGLCVRTQPLTGAEDVAPPEVRCDPFLSQTGGVQQHSSASEPQVKAHSAQAGSLGLDEPCKTPRLAPLRPRPVLPDRVTTQPRRVSRNEEQGTTAIGRCCAAVAGSLCGGLDDKEDDTMQDSVDAVAARLEAQRQALVDLEASILEAQKKVLSGPDIGSFIVLFKTPAAATLAARSSMFPQSTSSLEAFKVQPAPSPEDMLWQSLWKPPPVRRDEYLRCMFWYALLYLVPTGIFTAALNSISYGLCNSPALGPQLAWFCDTRFLQFLFTVVLPLVLVMLWQNAVIPANLYKLELRRATAVSLSGMERNILLVYVGWELCNLFLGGVLGASLVSQIKMLADNPDNWALLLGAAFPNSSNFFLNYVIARAFMMNLFRLIMPHGGMWRWIGQMLFTGFASFKHAATERYRSYIIYPASIRYGREPGLILLILLLGVAYSVAAPLITPFVLAYMCTAYLVWRYQMIYVCVRAYESGGKMWPVYYTIVLWIMGLFVVFTCCIFIFKDANVQGVLVLPLLPLIYMFARYCRYNYSSRVEHPPLWLAHEAPRTEIDPLVYTPTCLQPHAQGWYFEMGKAWVRWGVPAYVDPSI